MKPTGLLILACGALVILGGRSFTQASDSDPKGKPSQALSSFEKEWLKAHPDVEMVRKWGAEMTRGELELHDHSARDRLVRYARDTSHDEAARAAAVECLASILSEENLKLTASFLTDPGVAVRNSAYYHLPPEILEKMEDKFGDYDYTRPHPEEEFKEEMAGIFQMIEEYARGKKPRPANRTP